MRRIKIIILLFLPLLMACNNEPLDLSGEWQIINWTEGSDPYVTNADNKASLNLLASGEFEMSIFDNEFYGNKGKWEINNNNNIISLDFEEGDIFSDDGDIKDGKFSFINDTLKITGTTNERIIYLELIKTESGNSN